MESILAYLDDSWINSVLATYSWAWPTLETLHFVGLCLLFGVIATVDLRLVGFFKSLSYEWLDKLISLAVAGFILNLVTGVLFFIGNPFRYYPNISFQWKMLFVLLAGVNLLIYLVAVRRKAKMIMPGDSAPLLGKFVGFASVALWTGVIVTGRMIPFFEF